MLLARTDTEVHHVGCSYVTYCCPKLYVLFVVVHVPGQVLIPLEKCLSVFWYLKHACLPVYMYARTTLCRCTCNDCRTFVLMYMLPVYGAMSMYMLPVYNVLSLYILVEYDVTVYKSETHGSIIW